MRFMNLYMKNLLVLFLDLCSAICLMAQPEVVSPTRASENLKGPVRVVQYSDNVEIDSSDVFYISETTTKEFDKEGRLQYSLHSCVDLMDDIFSYEYDESGHLKVRRSHSREIYDETYFYSVDGHLMRVTKDYKEPPFNEYNTTYKVLSHDGQGHLTDILDSSNNSRYHYVYSRRGQLQERQFFLLDKESGKDELREIISYQYNDKGDMVSNRCIYGGKELYTTQYEYPSEYQDQYGNWLIRNVISKNGDGIHKWVERRIILYYED